MSDKMDIKRNLKKNKRRRILKYLTLWVVIFSIVFVFSFVLYSAFSSGLFNIKNIEVSGNEVIDTQSIIEASGIQIGENIFALNLNNAHFQIKELVNVERLEINKVLPDKITIKLKEVPSMFILNFDSKINYIDRSNKLVEQSDYLKLRNIPVVTGFEEIEINGISKEVIVNPKWKYDVVIEVLKSIQADGNLGKISEVGITKENTYVIITKNDVRITFKDSSNFWQHHNYITGVLKKNSNNLDINLTVGTNPIIKTR